MPELSTPISAYSTIKKSLETLGLLEKPVSPKHESPDCVTCSIGEVNGFKIPKADPDSSVLRFDCLENGYDSQSTMRDPHKVKAKLLELAGIESDVLEANVLVDMKQPEFEGKLAKLFLKASEKRVAGALENLDANVTATVQSVKDSIPMDQSGRKAAVPGVAAKTIVETIKGLQELARELDVANMVEAGLSPRTGRERAVGENEQVIH